MLRKCLLILIVLPLFFVASNSLGHIRQQVLHPSHALQEARPMTLAEAWKMVQEYARRWHPGADIVALQSVDHITDSVSSGQDGRRRAWQATLLKHGGTEVVITLVDGQVQEESQQPAGTDRLPLPGYLTLDSPGILQRVLEARPSLSPDNGKGHGYHFVLETMSGTPVVTVLGVYGGMPAMVSVDASTGALLAARYLGFQEGGILYSQDAGRTWEASDLTGKMIPAIAPDPLSRDGAYAVTTQDQHIVVYRTSDSGQHWHLFGVLPASAGDWPFDLTAASGPTGESEVFVGTWSGVWRSADGKEWTALPGLPDGPKQWLAVAHSRGRNRLFVSITAGADKGLYASTDGSAWEKVTQEPLRLSESFDRSTVLATSEQQGGLAWVLSADGETPFRVNEAVLRAAGDFSSTGPAVLQSPLYGLRNELSKAWTLSVPVASLAAPPDFPTSRTVIAGGFRSGIYRSPDAGKTWEMVLANPSEVVPGSNEILDMAFLSPQTVIAVNGGILTWKDF